MLLRLRPALTLVGVAATLALVSGCGSADDWSRPHARPSAVGTLAEGFTDPASPPRPESTITPRPGSWDGVHPSEDYRVVLLTAGDDEATGTLVDAVRRWADDEEVSLKTVTATDPHHYVDKIDRAIKMAPDLIVTAGNDLVDPLAMVSASHLDQPFLVVGAELAEPTHNVTAADWTGASFRGEGLGASSTYDPASFTAERAMDAVRAGVAAVLSGVTGIVIWLD
ncbi:hypothetical protein GCM10023350_22630 [Nocardioides endophyticus]|uniref:BMP family ABC transporter substrate-binding protein n=1 Tax=Nocardioides endophyticus TaxID=1353775 RepID=A0ABP8YUL6_9ACTN